MAAVKISSKVDEAVWQAQDPPTAPLRRFVSDMGALTAQRDGQTIRIDGTLSATPEHPGLTLILTGVRRWQISGRTALLEFRLLDDTHDLNAALGGKVPSISEVLYQENVDPQTG